MYKWELEKVLKVTVSCVEDLFYAYPPSAYFIDCHLILFWRHQSTNLLCRIAIIIHKLLRNYLYDNDNKKNTQVKWQCLFGYILNFNELCTDESV